MGEALFGAYGGNPSPTVLQWGDRIADQYGADATAKAIGVALLDGRDKLMSRAEGALRMEARHADLVDRETEQAKVREGHKPLPLAVVVESPDPVKVDAIMEGLRAQLGFGVPHAAPKPVGKKR